MPVVKGAILYNFFLGNYNEPKRVVGRIVTKENEPEAMGFRNEYGKDIIGGRQLLNILSDLTAFRYEVPALRNTLGIILDTYGLKILNAQALDKPGAVTLNQYKHDFCESYGMREDIAEYVFDSLGYGIGWIQYISSNVINKSVLDDKESK